MSAEQIHDADVVPEPGADVVRSTAIVPHAGSTELIVAASPAEQIRQTARWRLAAGISGLAAP